MRAFRLAGVLEEDPAQVAELWDHGCRGVIQDGDDIVAYFDEERDLPLDGTWEPVDDVDWLDAYFAGLEPVDAGPLVVVPTHLTATLGAGQKPLWLDPGMAFGTGHHETTRMILRAMGGLDLRGRSVVDVGSGSGILAIAADLLGAARALGIDNDPATLPVARANAELNRSRATFVCGTLLAGAEEPGVAATVQATGDTTAQPGPAAAGRPAADTIAQPASESAEGPWQVLVANLFAELHAELMPVYVHATMPGAQLLLSGIAEDRLELVLDAIPEELSLERREADGPWFLLTLERR